MQKNHLTLKNIYVYLHVTNEFSDSDEDDFIEIENAPVVWAAYLQIF